MSFRDLLKKANVIGRIGALEKSNAVQSAGTRPFGELSRFGATQKLPIPYYYQLRFLAKRNTSLRTIIHVIQDKVLERNPEFIPLFASKCMECGKEYTNQTETCDCGGMTRDPDQVQLEHLKEFFKDCNDNDQSFKAVLHECEDNLNVLDDAFLLILKEYSFDADNNLNYARVREMLSADPEWFTFDLDNNMRQGTTHWTCVEHRIVSEEPGVCGECGKPLFPVWYIYDEGSQPMPYLKDEIIHLSRYSPSKTHGYPPVATVFEEAMIELNGNVLLNDTYREQRPPKGILAIVTKNLPSLQKFWQKEMEQVQLNPNHMPVMGIESDSGRGSATYTALLNSVADMDVLNVSERMRESISGLYRISPLYRGSAEGVGGLNAEDVQRAVTAEPIASAHQGYHDDVFPKLLAMFGITDWTLEFPSPYPATDDADLDKRTKETQIATMMHGMGFEIALDDEDGSFIYSGEAQAAQPDMGGFGGDEDFGDDGGYQDELLLGKALQKARKYITDPSKAPEGVKVQRGKKGGYFYDAAPVRTSLKAQPEEVKTAVKDLFAEGMDAKMITTELEEKHGVKVHPETVNRFLEREGVETTRVPRKTVSRADVTEREQTITEQSKQIEDMGGEIDILKDDVKFYKDKYAILDQKNTEMTLQIANLRAAVDALKTPVSEPEEEVKPDRERDTFISDQILPDTTTGRESTMTPQATAKIDPKPEETKPMLNAVLKDIKEIPILQGQIKSAKARIQTLEGDSELNQSSTHPNMSYQKKIDDDLDSARHTLVVIADDFTRTKDGIVKYLKTASKEDKDTVHTAMKTPEPSKSQPTSMAGDLWTPAIGDTSYNKKWLSIPIKRMEREIEDAFKDGVSTDAIAHEYPPDLVTRVQDRLDIAHPENKKEPASQMTEDVVKIVKTLKLNFLEVAPVGKDNVGGWSPKQEKEIIHNVNRFAAAAKKQYNEGDFKNAYPNMRNYATAKNKLLGEPIDEFDLSDSLIHIDRQMRTTMRKP